MKNTNFLRISIRLLITITAAVTLALAISADDKEFGFPITSTQTAIEISDTSLKLAPAEISETAQELQEIEYGLSSDNNINAIGNWQTVSEFTGLSPSTQYHIFIRSRENNNYQAGALKIVDPNVTITTAPDITKLDTARIYPIVEQAVVKDSPFNVIVPTGVLVDIHNAPQRIDVHYLVMPNGGVIWLSPFTDVTESDWFFNDLEYVYANSLYRGTSESEFEPDSFMTRGMFTTVLWRQAGCPMPSGGMLFADLAKEDYYTQAVVWAAENKILTEAVGGLPENKFIIGEEVLFEPKTLITREQVSVILHRYAEWTETAIPEIREFKEFGDIGELSSYVQETIRALYCAGIIEATADDMFDPHGNVTRAETAGIFRKFIETLY